METGRTISSGSRLWTGEEPPDECHGREQTLNTNQNNSNNKNQNKIKIPNPKANPTLTSSLALSLGGVLAANVVHKVQNDKKKIKKSVANA